MSGPEIFGPILKLRLFNLNNGRNGYGHPQRPKLTSLSNPVQALELGRVTG